MTRTMIAAALAAAAVTATAAWAATPAENIEARQSNFKQMGRAQKAISDELKKSSPDVAVIRSSAQKLAAFAPTIHLWFPRGTGKEAGVKTGALPAVWQDTAKFNRSASEFNSAARTFQQAAASGDIDRIKVSFRAVGAGCKGCHDTFKGDK